MKKIFLSLFVVLVSLFFIGCEKADLKFEKTSFEVNVGDIVTLIPELVNTESLVDYSFSNADVIEIAGDNSFKAIGEGEAVITASLKDLPDVKVIITITAKKMEHVHEFDLEVADEKFLATEATEEAKATYYKSCECGEKGIETFEYGEKLAHAHVFDLEVVDEKFLATEATEEAKATYYKSCECGEKGTETFEHGEEIAHVHVFDQEVSTNAYLKSNATVDSPAIYYKSCECGEKGTETFEHGDKLIKIERTITYDTNGGALAGEYPLVFTIGISVTLPIPYKEGSKFLGWKINGEGNYTTEIDETEQNNVTLVAQWDKLDDSIYITYAYDAGNLPTHTATSFEELADTFWNEFYAWSGYTGTLASFKTSNIDTWKTGAAGTYKVYLSGGANVIDNGYFVNAKGNEKWMEWINVFEECVKTINSGQSIWTSTYVGYIRLSEYFGTRKSYWTTTLVDKVTAAYPIKTPLITKVDLNNDTELVNLTIDDGRYFLGWFDSNDNKVTTTNGIVTDTLLTAKWSASTPVMSFAVNNLITEIERLNIYALTWTFTPENATNKNLKFKSSDSSILSIDEDGIMTAHKDGTVTITIEVQDNSELNVSFTVNVYINDFIDINFSSSNMILVGDTITVIPNIYSKNDTGVVYKSLNPDICEISSNGVITSKKSGFAQFEVSLAEDESVKTVFGVTVLDTTEYELYKAIADAHNTDIHVTRDLNVAYAYLTDVYTSVSDLLFNHEYEVNREYEATQASVSTNHGGLRPSTEFVCVHYTAGTGASSTGAANAAYFARGGSESSIHYTTGNDGVFHILDDSLVGWHAGDGTGIKFTWTNTGVKATANVKPDWGVVKNASSSSGYYFTINGQNTTIVVPTTGTKSNGSSATMVDPSKCFTYFGPAWKVVDGYYYIGTTWACFTQTLAGAISSRGGNNNSIGIETACNRGSDLWLTYQYTAELVARLLDTYSLDFSRVVGHNMFSGKDCPQTLLANGGELWEIFMECVVAEYNLYTTMTKDNRYTISAVSSNTDVVSNDGRVLTIPNYSKVVEYTVTIIDNLTKTSKDITFSTVIHGTYTE